MIAYQGYELFSAPVITSPCMKKRCQVEDEGEEDSRRNERDRHPEKARESSGAPSSQAAS